MNNLLSLSISTAIFSCIWGAIATCFSLPGWIGFLGCTAYFSLPEKNHKNIIFSLLSISSGVFWAVIFLHLQSFLGSSHVSGPLLTGIAAFLMCYQSRLKIFVYIPGAFIGASTAIAGNGEWPLVLTLLISGVAMGYLMEKNGYFIAVLSREIKRLCQ